MKELKPKLEKKKKGRKPLTQKAQITEEKTLTCWPSPFKAFVLQNTQ